MKTAKFFPLVAIAFFISLVFLNPQESRAESNGRLFLLPQNNTYSVNQTFNVEIRVDSGGQSINTATANLSYPATLLEVTSVDTTNSFVTIWFENDIAEALGEVHLTGSLPTPGTSGSNLLLATLKMKALAATTSSSLATLNFLTSSAIYLNSDNSNILGTTTGGTYTFSQSGSGTPTPTPSPTPPPAEETDSTPTPIPTGLPDVGVSSPTLGLMVLALMLIGGGIFLLTLSKI